jgi:hypothetical protein
MRLIWEGQISVRVTDSTEILLSLTTVKNVMISMNKDWCHWGGKVSAGRVKGRIVKWDSKSRGREQLSIQWELGIRVGENGIMTLPYRFLTFSLQFLVLLFILFIVKR